MAPPAHVAVGRGILRENGRGHALEVFEKPALHPHASLAHLPAKLFEVRGDFGLCTECDLCFEFIQFDIQAVHRIHAHPRVPLRRTRSAQIKFHSQFEVQDFAGAFHQQVDFTCGPFAQLHHVIGGLDVPLGVVPEPRGNTRFEAVA